MFDLCQSVAQYFLPLLNQYPLQKLLQVFISCIDLDFSITILTFTHCFASSFPLAATRKKADAPLQTTATSLFDNFINRISLHARAPFVVFSPLVVPHNTHAHHPAHTPCSSPIRTTFFKEIAEIYAMYEIYEAGKIDKKPPASVTAIAGERRTPNPPFAAPTW